MSEPKYLWDHFLAHCLAIKTNDEVTTIHKNTNDATTTQNIMVTTTTNTNIETITNGIWILNSKNKTQSNYEIK